MTFKLQGLEVLCFVSHCRGHCSSAILWGAQVEAVWQRALWHLTPLSLNISYAS